LPDGEYHIYGKGDIGHQRIDEGRDEELSGGEDHLQHTEHGNGNRGHDNGPHGAAAVLQHGEQRTGKGDEQRHAVEHFAHDIARGIVRAIHQMVVTEIEVEEEPPRMAQRSCGIERCRPAAQAHRRRDVGRDDFPPAQQQVEAQHDAQGRRSAVEHEVQYRLW